MIFQHTHLLVLDETKTQTRRQAHIDDILAPSGEVVLRWNPKKTDLIIRYQVGKTYAVQAGRGTPSLGRIELKAIGKEDVRLISEADVAAEGFKSRDEFFVVWSKMYDPRNVVTTSAGTTLRLHIGTRNPSLFDAWVLTFELVKEMVKHG